MAMSETITMILVSILLMCGYLMVVQISAQNIYNRRMLPILAAVEFILYSLVVGAVIWLYYLYGKDPLIIFGALLIAGLLVLVLLINELVRNWSRINKVVLVLFVIYAVCVCYLTIMGRETKAHSTINVVPFQRIMKQLEKGDQQMLNHLFLNVLMMVPFGILVPLIHERLNKFSYAFLSGMMVSIVIETVQLVFRLGECDIDDVISNTLGAAIGYLICSLTLKIIDAHRYTRR